MDSFQAIDRHDSRYSMKQRDIATTVARMGALDAAKRKSWEDKFGDELTAVTEEAVLRGGGDRCILHDSDRYRINYEKWLRSCK